LRDKQAYSIIQRGMLPAGERFEGKGKKARGQEGRKVRKGRKGRNVERQKGKKAGKNAAAPLHGCGTRECPNGRKVKGQ
jgi:hypothetical protein